MPLVGRPGIAVPRTVPKWVELRDVSRLLTSDEFVTRTKCLAESGGRADGPSTSNTPAVCPCEANSGCFRTSDRLAVGNPHPLEIADFHGILV